MCVCVCVCCFEYQFWGKNMQDFFFFFELGKKQVVWSLGEIANIVKMKILCPPTVHKRRARKEMKQYAAQHPYDSRDKK